MDIKNICIVAFAAVVCANACADVTKLKTVTMVTNLVYDTELEHRRSCVSAPNSHMNRYTYWDTADTNVALWAAVLYSRYDLAEESLPVEKRHIPHPNHFVAMHPSEYVIDNICVTNMDAEVFTFSVENPEEEIPGRFALIKFSEGGLFMYAVYVNLATGASDLEFSEVSGAWLLVAHDLIFPFLDKRECRYQKAIVARIKGERKFRSSKDIEFNMCAAHYAKQGYCRNSLTGYGEILEYSFGRTNYCDSTAFEVREGTNKFMCVTNTIVHISKDFDVATLYHDAKSRRLFRVSVSRSLPDSMSAADRIKFLNSISKAFDYMYRIKVPIPRADDVDALMKNNHGEWSVENGDDRFLLTLSLSVSGNKSIRVTMTVESKQVRHPIKRRPDDAKDVEVELVDPCPPQIGR